MNDINLLDAISLISAIFSIVLAIIALITASKSEREVRENFEKTQKMMVDYESRIKDLLAEINPKSAVIEKTVSESQQSLMATMTNIINETVIPKKADFGEQAAMQFLPMIMENPEKFSELMHMVQDANNVVVQPK